MLEVEPGRETMPLLLLLLTLLGLPIAVAILACLS
mgnify:CR=1 FL=1